MKQYGMVLALIVGSLPTAVLAQVQRQNMAPSPQAILRAGDGYQGRTRADGYDWFARDGNLRECLKHRKTGRIVCLTRPEWVEVASNKRSLDGKNFYRSSNR